MGKVSDFRPCSGSFVNTNGFVCVCFFLLVVGAQQRELVQCTMIRSSRHHDVVLESPSRVSRQVLPASGFLCEGEDAIQCCSELTLRLMSLAGLF